MMKEREYLNSVLAINNLPTELAEETRARIAKLDEKNEKRKSTPTKTQKENEPIAKAIVDALTNGSMLGVDLATAIGQTVNKTNGVAGTLVNAGVLVKSKTKVKGKGEMTTYALAVTVADEDEETTEESAEE